MFLTIEDQQTSYNVANDRTPFVLLTIGDQFLKLLTVRPVFNVVNYRRPVFNVVP